MICGLGWIIIIVRGLKSSIEGENYGDSPGFILNSEKPWL